MNTCLNRKIMNNILFLFVLFFYTFLYNPFIFEAYVQSSFRITIELIVLMCLVMNLNFRDKNIYILLSLIVMYGVYWGTELIPEMGGGLTKIVFLVFLINYLLEREFFLRQCSNALVMISSIAALMSLAAFFGYLLDLLPFTAYDINFDLNGEVGNYEFIHNSLLGNLLPREIFGTLLGRACWWMFEGQYLGAFFGICFIGLKDAALVLAWRKRYQFLILLGGITTLSTSFLIFFTFYFLLNFIESLIKKKLSILNVAVIFFSTLLLLFTFFKGFFESYTSFLPRLSATIDYLQTINKMGTLDLIFGFGKLGIVNISSSGIDYGWALVFLQFGTLISIFILIIFIQLTKHDKYLMLYLIFINSTFNLTISPFFLLIITVVSICGLRNTGNKQINYNRTFSWQTNV